MIGAQLEEAGWRQGSVVKPSDLQRMLDIMGITYDTGIVLIAASQSCDIANNNIETDPYVEFSVARNIETSKGNLTFNKNPRILHTQITCRTSDDTVFTEDNLELKAFEKATVPKECLIGLQPDLDRVFESRYLESYVAWLAARYSRPALPTAFNDRISAADPKGKLRDKAKKANQQLTGIYVEITPDAEISDSESYNINLLGLLPARFTEDRQKAETAIKAYADILSNAGMTVVSAIRSEDEISVADIKRFKRFYLDDLSFRDETPLPPETTTVL